MEGFKSYPQVVAYVGIGSNLANPCAQVKQAVANLKKHNKVSELVCSKMYRNPAVLMPGQKSQPDYINMVVRILTDLGPYELLGFCQDLEEQSGRVRVRPKLREPRPLDLDILFFGNHKINSSSLQLPHPCVWNREFVIRPLADVIMAPYAEQVHLVLARDFGHASTCKIID